MVDICNTWNVLMNIPIMVYMFQCRCTGSPGDRCVHSWVYVMGWTVSSSSIYWTLTPQCFSNLFGPRDWFRGRHFFHGWGMGRCFGMIQVHYFYCTTVVKSHQVHLKSSGIRILDARDPFSGTSECDCIWR